MISFLKPPLNRRFALILDVGAMWLLGGLGIGVLHRRRPLVLCRPRWLITLFALATAFVAVLFFFTSRAHEPVYQGKRLSVWLENYLDRDGGETTTEQARAADRAVQHIGTNALPFLIEMIRAKDPWLKIKLIDLVEKERWIKIHILPAGVVRERGWKAFQALGGIAKPAIPELARLLNESDASGVAGILPGIGAESIPVLTNAVCHPDARVRAEVVCALGEYLCTPENSTPLDLAEQSAIDAATPGIVYLLLERLKDSDAEVRGWAAEAIGHFAKEPALAVPALLPLLEDEDENPDDLPKPIDKRRNPLERK